MPKSRLAPALRHVADLRQDSEVRHQYGVQRPVVVSVRSDGLGAMSGGPATTRVAIAVFEGFASLYPAMTALLSGGLTAAQLGIIVQSTAHGRLLDEQARHGAVPPEIVAVVGDVEPSPGPVEGGALVVTRHSIWRSNTLLGSLPEVTAPVQGHSQAPHLRDDLVYHLRCGNVVLGVQADGVGQQRVSTRILLQHSPYRVQTHEFRQ